MAPFRVPEVLQDDIPAASRISILDNLPAGAITVGGQRALDEIVKGLTPDQHPGVWLAIARALTREKSVLWFEKLDECLADVEFRAGSKPAHFWNWMATLLYLTLRENQPLRQEWHRRILTWREKYPESLSVEGIDSLVETLESMPV